MTAKSHNPAKAVMIMLLIAITGGCAMTEKRADLLYRNVGNARGASSRLLIARPALADAPAMTAPGKILLGRTDTDLNIVTRDNIADWVMQALAGELGAAGYTVETVTALPGSAPQGLRVRILDVSAQQENQVITIVTRTEIRMTAEVWRRGALIKTLSVAGIDREEGFDRSSWPVTQALQKTLQEVMRQLVPDVIRVLAE